MVLNFSIAVFSFAVVSSSRSFDLADRLQDVAVGAELLAQLLLEARHLLGRDVVEVAVDARVERDDLLLHRPRRVLRLVERRDHLLAAVQRRLRRLVELGAELGERLELAVLGEVEAQAAGDLLHRLGLSGAADAGDRDADVHGRADAREEQVGLQEDLPVGDRDHVRRDVGGDVAGLRLDDRQGGERPGAQLVVQLARALEQPRVQVEDVARERLAARRAAKQQRELPVGVGLLGQVVVDDERVLAVVEEVLAHGGAGERGHPLDRRCLVCGRGHDRRVLHRAGLAEALVHLGDRRGLLADGDVDALHVLVVLVQDRVDGDRRLAGRAVADDQLALAAADVRHRVDRLDPGLERLLHRLALDHAGGLPLERAGLLGVDRALPVERVAERVDDAAEQLRADGHRRDLAGAADGIAFLDLVPVAEQRDADVVLLEVEGEADDPVVELEHLERHAVLEPVDAGDAVAELEDRSDLGEVRVDVELLDAAAEDRRDLFGTKLHWLAPSGLEVKCLRAPGGAGRGGRARSRRGASSRPGGRSRRSGPGRRCGSPGPCGRTSSRCRRRCA